MVTVDRHHPALANVARLAGVDFSPLESPEPSIHLRDSIHNRGWVLTVEIFSMINTRLLMLFSVTDGDVMTFMGDQVTAPDRLKRFVS